MYRLARREGTGEPWRMPDTLSELQYRLLLARGIASAQEAEAFLMPLQVPLHDPMRMRGMPEAVETIRREMLAKGRICVYGDYDVDGVSACAILVGALESLGADVFARIPSRAAEGYGLNENAVRELADSGVTLLITVDCGISDALNVLLAKSLGMRVIVTDHHRSDGDALPDCLVVTAYSGEYPCPHLCGAGVAFKLACALEPSMEREYIDLAALATVADIVPLTGENRSIVALGLKRINEGARPGIAALLREAGAFGKPVTEDTLGFQLGPRLNAGGRLGSAERAYALLRAANERDAAPLAAELDRENSSRRAQENAILREARAMLENYDFTDQRAIVLRGENWNAGVIGIVASRLVEEYQYATILLTPKGGELRGSARSIPGVDIYLAIKACSDRLLRFGGHKAAAGLSLLPEEFGAFRDSLNAYLRENIPPEAYVPAYAYDIAMHPEDMTIDACEEMDALRPFGMGNPAPVILARFQPSNARRMGADNRHLRFRMDGFNGAAVNAVWFGHGDAIGEMDGGERLALCALQKNEFLGRVSPQCLLYRLLPEEAEILLPRAISRVSHAFLTSILYTDSQKTDGNAISLEQCADILRNGVQGTVFLALTAEAGSAFLREMKRLGAPAPDVASGVWTLDNRCFHTLCIRPEGAPPVGVKRVAAIDLPEGLCPNLPEGISACRIEGLSYQSGWPETLPDIDMLRAVYKAARRLSARPFRAADAAEIAKHAAREAELPEHAALAGLLALDSMGLIAFSDTPPYIRILPAVKTSPEDDPVFRNITKLRERRRRT